MTTYLVVLFGAALLALALTPMVVWAARRLGVVDRPGLRKVHADVIPRLGGVAVVVPTLMLVLPVLVLSNTIGDAFRRMGGQGIVFLVTSVGIFLLGLVDDIWGLSAKVKFLGQFLAAGAVISTGVGIESVHFSKTFFVPLGWLSIPLTFLWIIGITNAVNLIDGLDGLAAGISLITCGVTTAVAIYAGRPVMAVLMLAISGSLIGFLAFNFNPAKIFLGDCGSLFLGYVLAVSSILTSQKTSTIVALAVPVLALGVPIFDTVLSMMRRLSEGRSMFAPDRRHIHHRLLDRGLAHKKAVLVLYGVTVGVSLLGLTMIFVQDIGQLLLLAVAILLLALFFRSAGAMPIKQALIAIRRNQKMTRELARGRPGYEHAELGLQQAESFDDWWRALTEAAGALGYVEIEAQAVPDAGQLTSRSWNSGDAKPNAGRGIRTSFWLHDERGIAVLRIDALLRRGMSFQSAGRRTALLGRLLDRYGIGPYSVRPAVIVDTKSPLPVETGHNPESIRP